MFKYYLKLALRNQLHNKYLTLVNIFQIGLSIGASLLLFNYISYELSFDSMHSKIDNIYRVESKFFEGKVQTDDWATSSFGYGSAMASEIDGIDKYCRIGVHNTEQVVIYKDSHVRENGIAYTGNSFFDIFDFKLKEGNKNNQLVRPNTVVISEHIAKKLFRNENPIGKIITFAKGTSFLDCEVTGVLKDFPNNSHIKFNYLISYSSLPEWLKEFWYMHEAYTYVLLSPNANIKDIEDKFVLMSEKYKTEQVLKNKTWRINLVPLKQIHLNPRKQYERENKGSKASLIILFIMAIIILLVGLINYINIYTAKSQEKAKEIGIRLSSGAVHNQLRMQYFTESLLLLLESTIIASLIFIIANPYFSDIINQKISGFSFNINWIIGLSLFLLVCFMITAMYPAFVITKIKPAAILKGSYLHKPKSIFMRKMLIVFQYTASIILISSTLILYRHINFLLNNKLGADINNTIVVKYPVDRQKNIDEKVNMFAENIRQQANVENVTVSGAIPGIEVAFYASNKVVGVDNSEYKLYEMLTVDNDFINTYGLELKCGRAFDKSYGNETDKVIINEAALKNIGVKNANDALGMRLLLETQSKPVTIIGVLKNWHQRGLLNNYTPIMLIKNTCLTWVPPRFISIKTNNNIDNVIANTEKIWANYFTDSGFDYMVLNDFYNNQYKSEMIIGKVVSLFTILVFVISLFGMWTLTNYTLINKTKEIGIRKIHGATITNIIWLLSREFILLIALSLVISIPFTFWGMNQWIHNYAFYSNINAVDLIFGGIITIFIASILIVKQTWTAASRNQVNNLKVE